MLLYGEPFPVLNRRKSSLKLRKGSLEQDGAPISVVYNPQVDVVELNNVDGTATIDSSSEPPISDVVSMRTQFLDAH